MRYLINGRGGFIGIETSGNQLFCKLAWIDKFCPPTVDLNGFGVVQIPSNLIRQPAATLVPNLTLTILSHA